MSRAQSALFPLPQSKRRPAPIESTCQWPITKGVVVTAKDEVDGPNTIQGSLTRRVEVILLGVEILAHLVHGDHNPKTLAEGLDLKGTCPTTSPADALDVVHEPPSALHVRFVIPAVPFVEVLVGMFHQVFCNPLADVHSHRRQAATHTHTHTNSKCSATLVQAQCRGHLRAG